MSYQVDVALPLAKNAIVVAVKCGSVESVNHAYLLACRAFPSKPRRVILAELCRKHPVFKRVTAFRSGL